MRVIKDKINQEKIISKSLRENAFDLGYKKSKEIREIQNEHYKKFIFFKELNKAIEKDRVK